MSLIGTKLPTRDVGSLVATGGIADARAAVSCRAEVCYLFVGSTEGTGL
jgi:hypothetical protein